MEKAWVYILRCSDGSYYTGKSQELEQRIAQHQDGTLGGHTSTRHPVKLVFAESFQTYEEAIQAERQIKGWSRSKKEALIKGDFNLIREFAKCRNETHYKNKKKNQVMNTYLDSARYEGRRFRLFSHYFTLSGVEG